MSVPAWSLGPDQIVTTAQALLEAELPAVLALYAADVPFLMPVPQSYWFEDGVQRDWQSPGVGIACGPSSVVAPSALGSQDVTCELQVNVLVRLSDVSDPDATEEQNASYMVRALRCYCDAVAKVLYTYFPTPTYRDLSGIYRAEIITPIGELFVEPSESGDYTLGQTVRVAVYQRVRGRTPI